MVPLLEVNDLKIRFKTSQSKAAIVNGISFRVNPGETLGVVGESGCGKSLTSLSILSLLGRNAVVEGGISFNGKDLLQLSEKEMRKVRGNDISMIFQEPMTSLNPLQKIGRQIAEPIVRHRSMSKSAIRERVIELLNEVGIPRPDEIYESYPHELSGGMRQRIMIAIALACSPKMIIADEPTTALDVTIQAQILQLMKRISEEHGTSFMLITHDLGVVAELCDRVIVMYAGEIVEEADVRTLFASPKHPYTIGLMKSMPDISQTKDRLEPIPGSVPAVDQMPEGCRFAPRCAWRMDICSAEPALLPVSGQHTCRCWLVEEGELRA
jgi:peptide/nickel transport system ATP-binding protein